MTNAHRQASGFTLIEIAVVLFISGILLSAVISVINSLTTGARSTATQNNQQAIKNALATFLTRQSRLPCPALRTLASGATGDGVEDCAGATSTGTAPNIVLTGSVPWASLGLAEPTSTDGYANRFTYQVTKTATTLTSITVSGMLGVITIHSAGLGTTGNQTNDCKVAPSTTNPCAAVVVIVSHGVNGYGAYTRSGVQISFNSSITGNDERENANDDNKFVIKDYSGVDTNPYDDIVLALTPGDFLTPLAKQGTLKDYQATLNATIDMIKNNVIASAYDSGSIFSGNRYYSFPSSYNLNQLPSANRVDPWGNSITYSRSNQWISCGTSSSTTVFTLKSLGPDGVASTDDITYTITAADIQAIIAKAGCNN